MLHKDGSFSIGMLSAIPYRHHLYSWLWHVVIIDGNDRIGMRIIASRAGEAATRGIERYPWFVAERAARVRIEKIRKKEEEQARERGEVDEGEEEHACKEMEEEEKEGV